MSKPSPTEALAAQLSTVLDASELPYGDKVQALTLARKALPAPSTGLDDWRKQRLARGPIGSAKKGEELRKGSKSKLSET